MTYEHLIETIARCGYAHSISGETDSKSILLATRQIADRLGSPAAGRNDAFEEFIKPLNFHEAHPKSLSAQHGLNALPLHAELSHRPRICRYLLLACIEPGTPSVKTTLLDWRTLKFSHEELSLLQDAPVLVRNGRRSFYGTLLAADRNFLRYDPGCLESVDKRGTAALKLIKERLASSTQVEHLWERGDILIIDNWRMLHGRQSANHNSGRHLARILVHA